MRRYRELDSTLIRAWFYCMEQEVPGLVAPLESLFCNLTIPDHRPVLNLFDALIRYGYVEHAKAFDENEVELLPETLLWRLADLTIEDGVLPQFAPKENKNPIKHCFKELDHALKDLIEGDRLYRPYRQAYSRFVLVAAFMGLQRPQGQLIIRNYNPAEVYAVANPVIGDYFEGDVPSEEAPSDTPRTERVLRLVASNGKRVD